ncbi:carboxy methyl transferase for protein phosphatase 2A, partial [Tulasnella sp. 403]
MLPPPTPSSDLDAAIRTTDNDAAHARLSATRKGYFNDPYIHLLVPRAQLVPLRPPLINIGTFIRSEAIDILVGEWIDASKDFGTVQIDGPMKDSIAKYVEVDFPEITTRKAMAIRKHAALSRPLGTGVKVERGGTTLSSDCFHLLPSDLRDESSKIFEPLSNILSASKPTLLLAECVFPYMESSVSSNILKWFSSNFNILGAIAYEMFGLDDSFGETRNIRLTGVEPTIDSLQQRFLRSGFSEVHALSLRQIRAVSQISGSLERHGRVSTVESLDEVEELELVLGHYAIAWGFRADDAMRAAPIQNEGTYIPAQTRLSRLNEGKGQLPHGWDEFVHPEGDVFYYHSINHIMTSADPRNTQVNATLLSAFSQLRNSMGTLDLTGLEIYLECDQQQASAPTQSRVSYYFVDHRCRQLFWVDEIRNADVGLPDCRSLGALKSALTPEYWTHVDYYPRPNDFIRPAEQELLCILRHGAVDDLTSPGSTSPYSSEECVKHLNIIDGFQGCEGYSSYRVACIARLWSAIARARHINMYGMDSPRLD